MIQNLSNIGGIRFVPYGESAQRLYGLRTSGDTETKQLQTAFGRTRAIQVCYAGTLLGTACGMIFPGYSEPGKPILNVPDRIYLCGIDILTNAESESFASGGYLGAGHDVMTFESYDRSGESVIDSAVFSRDCLAVIPSPYHGGLRVDGLTSPGQALIHGEQGKYNEAVFTYVNGNRIYVWNYAYDYYHNKNEGLRVRYNIYGGTGKSVRFQIS